MEKPAQPALADIAFSQGLDKLRTRDHEPREAGKAG